MTRPLLRAEETREWLRLAARDMRVAELALADVTPLIGEALFHAQPTANEAQQWLDVARTTYEEVWLRLPAGAGP